MVCFLRKPRTLKHALNSRILCIATLLHLRKREFGLRAPCEFSLKSSFDRHYPSSPRTAPRPWQCRKPRQSVREGGGGGKVVDKTECGLIHATWSERSPMCNSVHAGQVVRRHVSYGQPLHALMGTTSCHQASDARQRAAEHQQRAKEAELRDCWKRTARSSY